MCCKCGTDRSGVGHIAVQPAGHAQLGAAGGLRADRRARPHPRLHGQAAGQVLPHRRRLARLALLLRLHAAGAALPAAGQAAHHSRPPGGSVRFFFFFFFFFFFVFKYRPAVSSLPLPKWDGNDSSSQRGSHHQHHGAWDEKATFASSRVE